MLLDWLKARADGPTVDGGPARQASLFTAARYDDEAPAIRSQAEFLGAIEHLEYAVFRRYQNQTTRAERARLDNQIRNGLFKAERYVERLDAPDRGRWAESLDALREKVHHEREQADRLKLQARRAESKLAQLGTLDPEGFEEFAAEIFEALGFEVERVGGTGDEGIDLRLRRGDGLLAVVQCKYHKQGVVGSPEVQKFLGTIHHTRSHKGFFVTTRTFSLAAERFAADHPIELIDGPRLVELVREALGPGARQPPEAAWF